LIPEATRKEILRRISAAEEEHGVRVLYAVESGSRAWGFASPNSDFDVGFVYARPRDWYLTVDLEDRRDVIEYEITDEIDINGWDVRKALKLLWKSNPAITEWLQSPIVYVDDGHFANATRSILRDVYSLERGIHHYKSMAKRNYRGYLKADIVPLKKYFYVLRPLLAIRWLERKQEPAPIEFHRLREMVQGDQSLNDAISGLLAKKQASEETQKGPAIPLINEFIESELDRLEEISPSPPERSISIEALNDIFRSTLDDPKA
jgi:predicted nucleotidyltransferase